MWFGENLPNSSCYFCNHKSIFLQILHQYSVPSNITTLYLLSSNIIYFSRKQRIKVQIFEIFYCSGQICQIPHVNFELLFQFLFKLWIILHCHKTYPNYTPGFIQILNDSSVSWKITPLHFFRPKFIYFAQKGLIKVQILKTFECSDQNSPNSCHF